MRKNLLYTFATLGYKGASIEVSFGEETDANISEEQDQENARIARLFVNEIVSFLSLRTLEALASGLNVYYAQQTHEQSPVEPEPGPTRSKCPKCGAINDHYKLVTHDRMSSIVRLPSSVEDKMRIDPNKEYLDDYDMVYVNNHGDSITSVFVCPACMKPLTDDDEIMGDILHNREVDADSLFSDDFLITLLNLY